MKPQGGVAARLTTIKTRGGMSGRDVATLLGTTPETVSRWQTGHSKPQRARLQRLLHLEWMIGELSDLFEPDDAHLWLFAPNRALGGATPAHFVEQNRVEQVMALIDQLRDGAFA